MSNEVDLYSGSKLKQVEVLSNKLSQSTIIPSVLRNKPQDVFAIVLMGDDLGLNPMQALNMINIIKGQISIKPQGMVALIRKHYPDAKIKITSNNDNKNPRVSCLMARHQGDGDDYESIWDWDRVVKLNLAHKDNYKNQPLTMMKWRAISDAARTMFPDIIYGVYTDDEIEDFKPNLKKEKKEPVKVENEKKEEPVKEIENIEVIEPIEINKKPTHEQLCKEVCSLSGLLCKDLEDKEKEMFKVEILEVNDLLVDLPKLQYIDLENLVLKLQKLVDEIKVDNKAKAEVVPTFQVDVKNVDDGNNNISQKEIILKEENNAETNTKE